MMAAFRGSKAESDQLVMYSNRLASKIPEIGEVEDVIAAIEKVADMPRESGELAFPEIGTLIALSTVMKVQRRNREAAASERHLVRFHCRTCGVQTAGFLLRGDEEVRVCRGLARIDKRRVSMAEICGGIMDLIHDERPAAARMPEPPHWQDREAGA
jgi:hypothetical protein